MSIREERRDESEGLTKTSTFADLIGHVSGLTKDVFIYGFAGGLSRVLSLFTAPILTRIFSVADYGVVDIISTMVGFFSLLLGANLTSGMWRYYYEVSETDYEDRKRIISSTVWLILGISIPLTLILVLMSQDLSMLLFNSTQHSTVMEIAILSVPLRLFHTLFMGMQRMRRKPTRYMFLNLANLISIFLFTILFVIVLRMGLIGIFLAQLVGSAVTMVMGLWGGRDLLALSFSIPWLKRVASFALPQLPGVFINWFLAYANRFFLIFYTDTQQVGYLSVANKIAAVLVLFTSAFRLAWDPFALSIIRSNNIRQVYSRALDYYLSFTFVIAVGLTLFSREGLMVIAPPSYWVAASLVGILVLRHILQGANNVVGITIAISKRTIFSSISLAIAAVFTILANLILTANMGVRGAAFAEVTGFFVAFVAYYLISKHIYPVPWNLVHAAKHLIGFIIIFIISNAYPSGALHWGLEVSWKLILFVLYVIFVYRSFSDEERSAMRRLPDWVLAQARSLIRIGDREVL